MAWDRLERFDVTRKVGQSKIPDVKLRQLITCLAIHRLLKENSGMPDLPGAMDGIYVGDQRRGVRMRRANSAIECTLSFSISRLR